MGLFGFINKQSGTAVGQIIDGAGSILDGLITNKEEKAKVFVELSKMQMELNKLEAASSGIFKGGWRPFIGWVCGVALAYNFILRDILNYVVTITYPDLNQLPNLNIGELMPIIIGMLGLGAFRSVDKIMNKSK